MVRGKMSIDTKNEKKLIIKKKLQINHGMPATKKTEFETKIDQMIKKQINVREKNLNEVIETLTKIIVGTAEKLEKKPPTNQDAFKISNETRKLMEKW